MAIFAGDATTAAGTTISVATTLSVSVNIAAEAIGSLSGGDGGGVEEKADIPQDSNPGITVPLSGKGNTDLALSSDEGEAGAGARAVALTSGRASL